MKYNLDASTQKEIISYMENLVRTINKELDEVRQSVEELIKKSQYALIAEQSAQLYEKFSDDIQEKKVSIDNRISERSTDFQTVEEIYEFGEATQKILDDLSAHINDILYTQRIEYNTHSLVEEGVNFDIRDLEKLIEKFETSFRVLSVDCEFACLDFEKRAQDNNFYDFLKNIVIEIYLTHIQCMSYGEKFYSRLKEEITLKSSAATEAVEDTTSRLTSSLNADSLNVLSHLFADDSGTDSDYIMNRPSQTLNVSDPSSVNSQTKSKTPKANSVNQSARIANMKSDFDHYAFSDISKGDFKAMLLACGFTDNEIQAMKNDMYGRQPNGDNYKLVQKQIYEYSPTTDSPSQKLNQYERLKHVKIQVDELLNKDKNEFPTETSLFDITYNMVKKETLDRFASSEHGWVDLRKKLENGTLKQKALAEDEIIDIIRTDLGSRAQYYNIVYDIAQFVRYRLVGKDLVKANIEQYAYKEIK